MNLQIKSLFFIKLIIGTTDGLWIIDYSDTNASLNQ
jgi:hypothetical protein